MSQSISALQQVWMSNTTSYNAVSLSVSTLGYGANANSSLLKMNVDGNTKFLVDAGGNTNAVGSATVNNLYTPNYGYIGNKGTSTFDTGFQTLAGGSGFLSTYVNGTMRMNIDSSGRVTKPYQPMFSAYNRNTATPTPVVNSWGSWNTNFSNWNTPRWNVGIDVGSNFNSSTGVFTAPVAGYYWFSVGMTAQYYNSSYLSFWKNGSQTPPYGLTYEYNAAASGYSFYNQLSQSYAFYMAAGDTMTGGCYFASNTWTSYPFYDGYVFISGFLIG
jgi:hypothetical protein